MLCALVIHSQRSSVLQRAVDLRENTWRRQVFWVDCNEGLVLHLTTEKLHVVLLLQVYFGENERSGGSPVSDPTGSPGGGSAARDGPRHDCTRLPSDTARHWGHTSKWTFTYLKLHVFLWSIHEPWSVWLQYNWEAALWSNRPSFIKMNFINTIRYNNIRFVTAKKKCKSTSKFNNERLSSCIFACLIIKILYSYCYV